MASQTQSVHDIAEERTPGDAGEASIPRTSGRAALPGEPQLAARALEPDRAGQGGGIRPDVLARVLDMIENRYHETLRVDDLGRQACLSPFHFARMFKISVGQAPHAYITTRRMQRARELLSCSEMPIVEVARSVGFRTQAHFSGVFRKHVGATPGQFRRQHRAGPMSIATSQD